MTRTTRHFAVALLLLIATACGTTRPERGRPASPVKSGTGELRTDLDPLTARFPLLAAAVKAEWMSGTLGDDRVPGPSTYWIDAVVTLPEATLAEIDRGTREDTTPPAVVEGLRDRLPGGPYLTGRSLDDAFTTATWSASAYRAKGTDVLVLVARGQ
ncbi:hypothetical protein GCM10022243_00540 [Saccharothrix violaceirubra]|uniref:Lipoprotein n=1 Tax=Saccharothrix violaceirubra TaxID=413306 RepID=A0A7W7T2K8_9PSEU|nr:hypothetical protein [Saccharothrix violaceirubra]MBB4965452.1 hypothetical protein [Saccharothrix violaceirubra]